MKRINRAVSIAREEGLQSLSNAVQRAGVNRLALYYGKYIKSNLARVCNSCFSDPYRTITVNPNSIQFAGGFFNPHPDRYGGRFSLAYYSGAEVRGGVWDKKTVPLEHLPKCEAVQQRFRDGESWENTGIYPYLLEKIKEGGSYDGCYSKDDLVERYKYIDNLYKSIKREGYNKNKCGNLDHICVNIGRNGELLFNGNGHHRLAIAQMLGIEEIPVRVLVRHKHWELIRYQFCKEGPIDVSTSCVGSSDFIDHPDIKYLNKK